MCVLVDLFHTTRCLTMYRFAVHWPFHDLVGWCRRCGPWMNSFGVLCSKEKIHLGWCLLLWMLWRHASRVTSQDVHWDHGRLHFVLLSLCKDRSNMLLEQPHPSAIVYVQIRTGPYLIVHTSKKPTCACVLHMHTHKHISFSKNAHAAVVCTSLKTYIITQIQEFLLLRDTNRVCRQNDLCCDPKSKWLSKWQGLRLFPFGNGNGRHQMYMCILMMNTYIYIYYIHICVHNYICNCLLSSTPTAVCTGFLVAAGFLGMWQVPWRVLFRCTNLEWLHKYQHW